MSKKNQKETMSPALLTTTQLEQSGIKTSLNQNDIVEIIAVEAYDRIIESLKNIPKFNLELNDLDKYKESFVKEVNKLKCHNNTFTKENVTCHYPRYNGVKENYTINSIEIEDSNSESTKVYLKTKSFTYYSEISHEFKITKKGKDFKSGDLSTILIEKDAEILCFSKRVDTKTKLSQLQIQTMINNHNQTVLDFYNNIPTLSKTNTCGELYKVISFKSISTQARVSVNKNIIKNQAPEVTEQLNKLFGVNL